MAQATVKRTMKKMMTIMGGSNHSSSSTKLLPSKSYSTFGRIPQLTTAKIIIPSHFSPTTTSQLYPCSSFYTARKMSSESAFQKAWAFAATQRAEALARAKDIMGATFVKIKEEYKEFIGGRPWKSSEMVEDVVNKLWAGYVIFYGARELLRFYVLWRKQNEGMMTEVDANHLRLLFDLRKYAGGGVAVYLLDGKHLVVCYIKQTECLCFKRYMETMLTLEIPFTTLEQATIEAQHDTSHNAIVVDVSSFKSKRHVASICLI